MKLTKIYVGSNNETGVLELDKIISVLDRWEDNFSIIEAMDFYNSKEEKTAIIEIYGNYNLGIVPELKRELKQDSILVVSDYKEVEFI